jgi:hypothetical protein
MAREFELDRRGFLGVAAAALLLPKRLLAAEEAPKPALAAETLAVLETSEFVYVSPLRKGGAESTCHGEVWYGWLDGTVVLNTRRGTWKVNALEKGLDRARIWVGDHGRWKGVLPSGERNESFRKGPSFEARAKFETDRAVNDRLMALYEKKYGSGFNRWREDMTTGFFSGQRKLIRYEPT